MKDVQSCTNGFPKVHLPWVGVSNVRYPVYVYYPDQGYMFTEGVLKLCCSLSSKFKGVHMSRFYSIVQDVFTQKEFLSVNVRNALDCVCERLESPDARIEVVISYFCEAYSPATKLLQKFPIKAQITGIKNGGKVYIFLSVEVPYTSLCPCSKEIAKGQGAHNQRSIATVTIEQDSSKIVTFEWLVNLVEKNASAPIREYLKREDEKWVTELAYEQPRFVEDMVRLLSEDLKTHNYPFLVRVCHQESIHVHDAIAYVWSEDFKLHLFNYLGG